MNGVVTRHLAIAAVAVAAFVGASSAHGEQSPGDATGLSSMAPLSERSTLTDNWFGMGRKLEEEGINIDLKLTQIYQINLNGGLATHRHSGRYTGSWDLVIDFSLEKLLGVQGGYIRTVTGGSWSDGLDDSSIGSVFGINGDAAGYRAVDVKDLYWEQSLFDNRLVFRLGKLDLTGAFDCQGCPVGFDGNTFANNENTQFLNNALINNPTIPFPSRALALIVHTEPVDGFYMTGAVADRHGDKRETGLRTAFHGPDDFLTIVETGITPLLRCGGQELRGAYRVGLWYDPVPKERFGGGTKRDDMGVYISVDQMVYRENTDDAQGLGVFARYGWADADVSDINCFWSFGLQYQGLCPGRDKDVLGFGVAQGCLSPQNSSFTASQETAYELYYSIVITPWIVISPSIQVIQNPGGDRDVDAAVVPGIRVRMLF